MILDAKCFFVHLFPFNLSIYLIYLSVYLFLAAPNVAFGILVHQPGIVVEVQSLNYWTAREVPPSI